MHGILLPPHTAVPPLSSLYHPRGAYGSRIWTKLGLQGCVPSPWLTLVLVFPEFQERTK